MKGLRFLLLGMAVSLVSGVKAQFYDNADDIYYYVEEYYEYEETYLKPTPWVGLQQVKTGKTIKKIPEKNHEKVLIFNFDGRNAAELSGYYDGDNTSGVKGRMQNSPSYYEDKVENTSYDWEFVSSSYDGTVYKKPNSSSTYKFSSDRNVLTITWYSGESKCQRIHKKVDKSFFKIGRSRTPSGTMHE